MSPRWATTWTRPAPAPSLRHGTSPTAWSTRPSPSRRSTREPAPGRHRDGQRLRLADDAAGRDRARRVRRPVGGARRLRAPHAAPDARVRRVGRRPWSSSGDRGGRGSGAPAGHGRRGHAAAGDRRPAAAGPARRAGQPAVDRADAGRRAGGHGEHRRRPQRRAARRPHPRCRRRAAARRGDAVPGRSRRPRPGPRRRPAADARHTSGLICLLVSSTGLYALTDEHEAIREAVREIAEREIAPHAADVDAQSRFPIEAQKALPSAGFHATHIPEAYGGEGADAIATCIVIEEVARVDVSASLIPAVNKLGSMPIILSASEDVKQKVLRPIAAGDAMISYGLSEREAGSDAAAMKTRARLEGDTWVLNGTKAWLTNSGISSWYTVMAVTDPEKMANGISAFAVHKDDPGFAVWPKERMMGIKGSPTCELYFTDCTIPADRIIGEPGTGFKTALRTLDFTRPPIGAQAVGIAQRALGAGVACVKGR